MAVLAAEIPPLVARMADAAREVTLGYFRGTELATENKAGSGFDPVTQADRACERLLRDMLAQARPEDGILGEEFGPKDSQSGLTWVLDPIDGTRAFMSGAPSWGVLISLRDESGAIYGVIDQPYIGERFEGGLGRAQLSGPHGARTLGTRSTKTLSEAVLYSTYPEIGSKAEQTAFNRVADQVQLKRFGLDCYAYGLLALGQIDLVIEAGLQPYDILAPIAVIEAAGGVVTDWQGGPAHEGGAVIAAANPEIHAAALAVLQED
ncbi:MAG: histidinol-phosphatase [Mangrovicoccus sp.]|nr:histidinol-phosphatase [Mangrovicoccus sp.]